MLKQKADMKSKELRSCISAEIISSNLDILIQILLRLPAKSLLQFKCVSKQWLSLISDPKFRFSQVRCQQILNPTPTALLLNRWYAPTPEFDLVPLENDFGSIKVPFLDYLNVPRVKIHQSCNGLLLCSSPFLVDELRWKQMEKETIFRYFFDYSGDDDWGYRYFVCNPTTKQFKFLSHPTRKFDRLDALFGLAFDPLKSPHYKVIYIQFVEDRYQFEIYSSETDSWRLLPHTFDEGCGIRGRGVFWNGAIHWFSYRETSLYFDFESERLKIMPMPMPKLQILDYAETSRESRTPDVLYFGESRGHLHMVVSKDRSTIEFDVFEMVSDYSRWFVKYHVDLHSMIRTVFPKLVWHHEDNSGPFSVLSLVRAEKEEESLVVLFIDGRAMSYNLYDGISKKLCDLEPRPRFASVHGHGLDYEGRDAYLYFESLICV